MKILNFCCFFLLAPAEIFVENDFWVMGLWPQLKLTIHVKNKNCLKNIDVFHLLNRNLAKSLLFLIHKDNLTKNNNHKFYSWLLIYLKIFWTFYCWNPHNLSLHCGIFGGLWLILKFLQNLLFSIYGFSTVCRIIEKKRLIYI
jgi:hypothetical protein